jgi:1-acyl-sn-glycerol-3-phosphate acyltransferase
VSRRVPVTARRATSLVGRLPVNRHVVASVGRAGAGTLGRRLVPSSLQAPTVPGGVEPLPVERRVGADYDTDWARSYPARAARVLLVAGVVRPAMEVLAPPTVEGLDRLDALEGPVVFAANHHSHVDTPLLLSVLPEPWRHHLFIGAAADYFFGNRITSTLSALVIGAIPIERTKVTRSSADQAAALIDDGWSMLIFPEGGRSPDGWGQSFRGGAAYLSIRCGVPVVPVHVHGTDRILPKGRSVPRPTPTVVTFGTPLVPGEGEDSRRMAARIEAAVARLGDEATSDWWQASRRAARGETPSMQGPPAGAWRRTWALGDRRPGRRRTRRSWPEI